MPRMRADKRRTQLLNVAAELFAERGYRGTTTAELAKAAGVTEPILYRHFASKLELFVTLIEEVSTEVLDAWEAMLQPTTEPNERLRVLLAGNPATHDRGRSIYRVVFQAMTEFHSDPTIARALLNHLTRLHTFLEEELTKLQRTDVVRSDVDAGRLAWMLVSTAIGFGMMTGLNASESTGVPEPHAMQELLRGLVTSSGVEPKHTSNGEAGH
jgi:AcrR family transcriptional regulator